jgi:glycosyltransferase involved in cell wall biosynthesis
MHVMGKQRSANKLKVLFLADALDNQRAGVHIYIKGLLDALHGISNLPIEIVLVREKSSNQWSKFTEKVLLPPDNALEKARRIFYQIPKLARDLKVDLVFEPAHFGPFNLPSTIKRVTFIHDLTPVLFPKFHNRQSAILQRVFLPSILKRADLVLCNSKYSKQDVLKHYPQCREVEYLYPGTSKIFYPDKEPINLKGIQLPAEYILSVGTLEPRKNLKTLIKAFDEIKHKGWSGKLVLTGEPGWKKHLWENSIEKSAFQKDILRTGFVDTSALRKLYSQCRVFVYPSIYEGFGLPVMEALQCGARIICSNSSSLPEVGGSFASYFDPYKSSQLVELLGKEIYNTDKQEIDKKTKHLMKFDWEESAKKFISLILKLYK